MKVVIEWTFFQIVVLRVQRACADLKGVQVKELHQLALTDLPRVEVLNARMATAEYLWTRLLVDVCVR